MRGLITSFGFCHRGFYGPLILNAFMVRVIVSLLSRDCMASGIPNSVRHEADVCVKTYYTLFVYSFSDLNVTHPPEMGETP